MGFITRAVFILAALAPALAVLTYAMLKAQADWRSEGLWSAVAMGGVAGLFVGFVHVGVASIFPSTPELGASLKAFFVAAIPEEGAKFLIVACIALRHVDVRREQDVLVTSVAVAMGFCALENLFYIIDATDWGKVATARALFSLPSQGGAALIMGALITIARLNQARSRFFWVGALFVPVLVHGLYDWPLFSLKATQGDSQTIGAWFIISVGAMMLSVTLGRWALRTARLVDQAAGRVEQKTVSRGWIGAAGLAMLLGPLILGVYLISSGAHPVPGWALLLLAALPGILGLDLIWDCISRPSGSGYPWPKLY